MDHSVERLPSVEREDPGMETKTARKQDEKVVAARRRFLANCGKFAVVTPPVVSLMLAASERNYAVANSSSHGGGGGGGGNGGSHGHGHHGNGHGWGHGRGHSNARGRGRGRDRDNDRDRGNAWNRWGHDRWRG